MFRNEDKRKEHEKNMKVAANKFRTEKNWPAAAQAYEQASNINPDHEDALFNLGNMYPEMNEVKKSKTC